MSRRSTPLVTLLACGILAATARAQPTNRAFVLDPGAHALVALDLASGQRTGVLPLPGSPTRLNLSDDGDYLVVLDRGPGEDKDERGYKATGRSSATVVDAASLKVVGHVELGFGLDSVVTPSGGRLVVTCPGYQAKNPAESLVRELVVVDLTTARETGRLTLDPGTSLTGYSRDGKTLALLQGLPRSARYPYPKSKITFLDAAGLSVTGTLDAGGWSFVARDTDRVYLIDQGQPDKNPEKNRDGAIDVVLVAQRRVEHVDVGRSLTGALLTENGLLAVMSEGPVGGAGGELRLIREGKLAAMLPVAQAPRLSSEKGDTVYVVGSKAVTLVDTTTLQVTGAIPLARGAVPIVGDDDRPTEMAVSADRRRAFIHYGAQHKVAVLDLEDGKAIGSTKTGRGGKKFLNNMLTGLGYATSALFYGGFGQPAAATGTTQGMMQVRPDGRFAYVLNVDTNDVTVVDSDTAEAVEKIGGGGYGLVLLGGPTVVAVGSELNLIDAGHNVECGRAAPARAARDAGLSRRRSRAGAGRAHRADPRRRDGEGARTTHRLREPDPSRLCPDARRVSGSLRRASDVEGPSRWPVGRVAVRRLARHDRPPPRCADHPTAAPPPAVAPAASAAHRAGARRRGHN